MRKYFYFSMFLTIALLLCLNDFLNRMDRLEAAQQPQVAANTPSYAVNAKYVQGVGPGYQPTKGSGLTLNVAAGTASDSSGATFTYAGGTLTMTNSTTNYVYLDTTASWAPATSTSTFTSTAFPIATVVAAGGVITSITDLRTMFHNHGASSGGSAFGTPPATPNIAFLACDLVSGGVASLGFCWPGMPGRTVSGASDTIVATDRGSAVLYTNGGAVAVTAPQLSTTNFANNFNFFVKTATSTVVTITPTTSQIAGNNGTLAASLVIPPSSTAYCYGWDNANYQCTIVPGYMTASLTTTAAASDNVTVSGMTSSGHCTMSPTNANAAIDSTSTYISAKTTNQITVTHPASSGRTWDIVCSPN